MILQLPIFLVPPQGLVPYAQRVVRVMGAAALSECKNKMQTIKLFFTDVNNYTDKYTDSPPTHTFCLTAWLLPDSTMTYRGRSDGLVVGTDRKKIITFKCTCHLRNLQGYCVYTFFYFFLFS